MLGCKKVYLLVLEVLSCLFEYLPIFIIFILPVLGPSQFPCITSEHYSVQYFSLFRTLLILYIAPLHFVSIVPLLYSLCYSSIIPYATYPLYVLPYIICSLHYYLSSCNLSFISLLGSYSAKHCGRPSCIFGSVSWWEGSFFAGCDIMTP